MSLKDDSLMPLCPYCGNEVIIKEDKHNGITFYDICHPSNDPCGILLYHWDKPRLIEWYRSMEWYEE